MCRAVIIGAPRSVSQLVSVTRILSSTSSYTLVYRVSRDHTAVFVSNVCSVKTTTFHTNNKKADGEQKAVSLKLARIFREGLSCCNIFQDCLLDHMEISIVEAEKRANRALNLREFYTVYLIETK